jgi:hypothetical protein
MLSGTDGFTVAGSIFMTTRRMIKWIAWATTLIFLSLVSYCLFSIHRVNREYDLEYGKKDGVALRKFPYPFKAALAVCSDIDNTETAREFLQIQEFLDTNKPTQWGRGVGLEIANSFYMYDQPQRNGFSYYSNKPPDKFLIQKFIRSGFIDCLHSFGEGCTNRKESLEAIRDLQQNNYRLSVWINHDRSPSNLGRWFSSNLGDDPKSVQYHTDVTIPYGIRFVWMGSSTCIVGQDVPVSFGTFLNIYDSRHPIKTLRNMTRTIAKYLLSLFGMCDSKYSMVKENRLVSLATLADGQKIFEFTRYDVHPDGIGKGANSKGIAVNLSPRVLDQLVHNHGYAILYTHLGKNGNCSSFIDSSAVKAFRYLEKRHQEGDLYVTTTSRLLNYYVNKKYLNWRYDQTQGGTMIRINTIKSPVEKTCLPILQRLQGLTFYVPSNEKARIFVNETEIRDLERNPKDDTGRESVTVPIVPLEYPKD